MTQPPPFPPEGTPPASSPYGYPPAGAPQGPVTPSDQRMWAMFAHLGGIFFGFIPALVIFLLYKDRDDYVRDQSAEALNFHITLAIAYVVSGVLVIVLIGLLLLPLIWIVSIAFGIIAAIAANRGERYRYPFALRLVH